MVGEAERPLSLRVRGVTKGTLELPVQAESANHGRRLEDGVSKVHCPQRSRSVNYRSNLRISFFSQVFQSLRARAACVIQQAEILLINAGALFSPSHMD